MKFGVKVFSIFATVFCLHAFGEIDLKPKDPAWKFLDLAQMPIQSGGRVKPFDSFARSSVLFITGKRSFENWDPVEMTLSWIVEPSRWEQVPFVTILREDVRRQIGVDEKKKYFSPIELLQKSSLLQYAEMLPQKEAQTTNQTGPKQDQREQELRRVLDRVSLFRNIASGQAWTVIPPATKSAEDRWLSLAEGTQEHGEVLTRFIEVFKAYKDSNPLAFADASKAIDGWIKNRIPGDGEGAILKVKAEVTYNRIRPYMTAWVLYFLSALLWGLSAWLRRGEGKGKAWTQFGLILMYSAVAIHTVGLGLRSFIAGRPPVSNMYESIVWVSLGVMVFAAILYHIQKQKHAVLLSVASTLAMLGLLAADISPTVMDPSINPLVPVLRSNFWLTIHVLTITLGYSAFALSYGLGNVTLVVYLQSFLGKKAQGFMARVNTLNQMSYRSMQFGVVLLAAGTILGGVWADYSWGRFWGWDPKEVWALIALLCYLIVLHGRFAGWIGVFGFAAWTVVSFSSVVMAWYGVNFVLGVGLHAYGFASGGFGWVASAVSLQLIFVLAVWVTKKLRTS